MTPKSPAIREHLDSMQDLTREVRARTRQALEENERRLTANERAVLEHFWNDRRQELRLEIPKEVLYFLEGEVHPKSEGLLIRGETESILLSLSSKGYLESALLREAKARLSIQGAVFLTEQHPTLLMYWARTLHLIPPSFSLIATVIGLVASVFGIVQFISWVRGSAT